MAHAGQLFTRFIRTLFFASAGRCDLECAEAIPPPIHYLAVALERLIVNSYDAGGTESAAWR